MGSCKFKIRPKHCGKEMKPQRSIWGRIWVCRECKAVQAFGNAAERYRRDQEKRSMRKAVSKTARRDTFAEKLAGAKDAAE